jgi:hypothetical protein
MIDDASAVTAEIKLQAIHAIAGMIPAPGVMF